jgi:YidC/Oxa1 family membrane protein insertase
MEKRVLIAVFLSFLVLMVYQSLVPPSPVQKPGAPAKPQSGSAETAVSPAPAFPPAQSPTQASPPAPAASPLLADAAEREVVVETPAVRAVFSNREAVLTSWRLKRYHDATGQPLELLPQGSDGTSRVSALIFPEPADTALLQRALFRPSAESITVDSGPQTLGLEYRDASGLTVSKSFTFDPAHPYVVLISVRAERSGTRLDPTVHFGALFEPRTASSGSSSYVAPPRAIVMKDGDVERIAPGDLSDPADAVHMGRFPFAGVEDHYFLSVLVRPEEQLRVEYRPAALPAAADLPASQYVVYSAHFSAPPANKRLFLGPKDFDVLQAVDRDLVRAIDFGMFAFLVVPLLRALKWINGWIGNYGWSIILLTILINLAMFPLRHKSVVSMRKMQEIQPEVKAIQDRYAKLKMSDPARQKMNVELMNLYRERGANPASGCVPMLLTFPVLIAFYSLLSVAIELRGAPFAGWIKDLSQPDPYYITPILMGATMVWQQKLTPMTSADPVQQKMMMFMPVMFTVFFLWAPSGLVLYWLVSNLWGIGQQLLTNRIIGPPKTHAMRPAAERRVKRVGGGKTDQAETGGRASQP